MSDEHLLDVARRWRAADPDPANQAEIDALVAGPTDALRARFDGTLHFGTAGLRAALGAGPQRMNRVVVRQVAAAIAAQLDDENDPHVVIGFDGRHGSAEFALDTARVLAARGVRTTRFTTPGPTPLLAFAVRHLQSSAGVMVTASHNPATDNGYKVYWRGGSLLTAPLDQEIAAAFATAPVLTDDDLAPADHPDLALLDPAVPELYTDAAVSLLDPSGRRDITIAHTALHGVGADLMAAAFEQAGFVDVAMVPGQRDPDPDFPTARFPNPEEPGALDLLVATAERTGATLALANDPDADRLAVVVRHADDWHLLSGDDVGCLLAEHLLARDPDPSGALAVTTITSSRLLGRIADAHRATYVETLTGFKWIMQADVDHPRLRMVVGYEEALGYGVLPQVRDKDGISAALVIAEMAALAAAEGQTLVDRRAALHRRHGVHVTGQRSVAFEPGAAPAGHLRDILATPPAVLADEPVLAVHDLSTAPLGVPATAGVVLETTTGRILIRPSGTEPKTKIYGEVADPQLGRAEALARLRRLLADAARAFAGYHPPVPGDADAATAARAEELMTQRTTGAQRIADLHTVIRTIDLTTLEGDDTPARVRLLCADARRPDVADPGVGPVAAVCVYPALVPVAAQLLGGTPVRVASVAGAFPSGLSARPVRLADIADAVAAGADEVDIVLDRGAFLAGDHERAAADIVAAKEAAGSAHLKVILEVGDLGTVEQIAAATRLAIEAGADVVKTSTGKTPRNATPASVLTMCEVVAEHHRATGRVVGVKIAGGVRTADDALGYVALVRAVLGDDWLTPQRFRFGASSLLGAVVDELSTTRAR